MRRQYEFTFTLKASGLVGSAYNGSTGQGVVEIEAVDLANPFGHTLTILPTISRVTLANGEPLPPRDISRLHMNPIQYVFNGEKIPDGYLSRNTISGDRWQAELEINVSNDLSTINVKAKGTGTGLARFAVNNVEITGRATS